MRLSQTLRWPQALVLLACLSNGIGHAATTAAPEQANAAASDIEPPATLSPIDLSSAINLQASVAAEAAQFTQQPAVPIPKNISKVPAYQYIARMAPALPIVQAGVAAPETEDLVANLALHSTSQKTSPISSRASTLRVMIVGDSITQGQNGDHTWRYRIWQWFQSQGVSVQFVGPYNGTYLNAGQSAPAQAPQPPPLYGTTTSNPEAVSANGKYAADVDAAFLSNSNHFANWGRAMVVDQGLIQNMLSQYPADMILVALGFNDLGFYYSDCYGLLNTVQNFINNARKANPNIKFAFANVVQRTFVRQDLVTNITTYNSILPKYLAQFSSPQSEVHLVEFEQNYACGTTSCGAGYDGLHPNAWGEYQIANAFSKSLIDGFGIGKTPLAIPSQGDPSLVRPLGVPANFKVFSSAQGVTATWEPVFGAYSYDVQVSINGGGGGFSSGTAATNRWDSTWPVDGWTAGKTITTVIGGTTTVEPQTSKTSSSTGGVVTSSIPSVDSNGGCTGPGCSSGHCTDLFCVSFGCKGSGCGSGGFCKSGTSCISLGCVGPNCVDGSCKGAGCSTKGCAGSDCNSSNGRCKGPNCVGVGCAGSDCGSNGVCTGPNCSEVTCFGLNCAQGSCVGPSCTHFGTNPGGGSNAPQSNPDDECGTNGDGVTSAESCDVTCYTRTSTETCSFPSCTETTGCSVTATTETTTLTGAQFEVPTADLFPAAYSLSDQGVLALITSAMASENSVDAATSPSTTTIPTSTTSTSTCTYSFAPQCTLTPNYEPGDVCNTANQQACNAENTKAMFCACAASDCQWQVQNNGDCSNASCVQSGGTASCGST